MLSLSRVPHHCQAAVALAFALAASACGAPEFEAAAPEPTPPASVAPAQPSLVLRDTNNRLLRKVDPGLLAHIQQRLTTEGRAAEAERLRDSYDFASGALAARLMPPSPISASGEISVRASAATIVNDPSYVYSCETYVTCSGWFWRTCTNPLYGCGSWFENSQWAGMFGYPLRHIVIVDRPSTPPPGAIPPPVVKYEFFRNGAWSGVINSTGPYPGWANHAIEAYRVFVEGDSRWQVSYGAASNTYQPTWYQVRYASNGQVLGNIGVGQPIQQYMVQVYRLEEGGGGPIIE